MGDVEIYETYHDLSQPEAFEVFAANDVKHKTISGLFGKHVLQDYMSWIYKEQK